MFCTTLFELIKEKDPAGSLLAAFMETHDLKTIRPGRYTLPGGAFISVEEYTTHLNERFEAHERMVDVQLVVSGCERILTAPVAAGVSEVPYDAEKDVVFYHCSKQVTAVDLFADQLVVLFPGDLHAPGNCVSGSTPVRKAVLKIPVALYAVR